MAEEYWADHINGVARGDERALAALYDCSGALVFGLALRILGNYEDAEEITVDVFAQVWRKAADFDLKRGNPAAWLTVLARSRAIDRYWSKLNRTRREKGFSTLDYEPLAPGAAPELNSILEQRRNSVRSALQQLSSEQRQILEMSFYLGYSHSELARKLGISLGTVKGRIRAGIRALRKRLDVEFMSEGFSG